MHFVTLIIRVQKQKIRKIKIGPLIGKHQRKCRRDPLRKEKTLSL